MKADHRLTWTLVWRESTCFLRRSCLKITSSIFCCILSPMMVLASCSSALFCSDISCCSYDYIMGIFYEKTYKREWWSLGPPIYQSDQHPINVTLQQYWESQSLTYLHHRWNNKTSPNVSQKYPCYPLTDCNLVSSLSSCCFILVSTEPTRLSRSAMSLAICSRSPSAFSA